MDGVSRLTTIQGYMTNLVTILIVPILKFLGMKSYSKRMKIQSVLKKNENVSFLEEELQYFIPLKRFTLVVNVINLVPHVQF